MNMEKRSKTQNLLLMITLFISTASIISFARTVPIEADGTYHLYNYGCSLRKCLFILVDAMYGCGAGKYGGNGNRDHGNHQFHLWIPGSIHFPVSERTDEYRQFRKGIPCVCGGQSGCGSHRHRISYQRCEGGSKCVKEAVALYS